jgi:hypothetical protein
LVSRNVLLEDHVKVIRKLGYEYIWIDSLCILQDCEQDWLEESAKMGDIFANADLNIAATGFSDGTRGIFSGIRDPSLLVPFNLKSVKRAVAARGAYSAYEFYLCERSWNNIENATLNHRGWVVQERALSPRILHFGRQQLFWECRGLKASDVFPRGLPDIVAVGEPCGWSGSVLKNNVFHLLRKEDYRKHKRWQDLVQYYSGASLTRTSDKLVAISGMASKVQRALGDNRYLAGLWERALPGQLLWSTVNPREATGLFLKYRAPTWSWASLDARITFLWGSGGGSPCAQLVEASITPLASNKYVSDTPGYVRISGPLRRVQGLNLSPDSTFNYETWCLEDRDRGLVFMPDLRFSEKMHGSVKLVSRTEFVVDIGNHMGSSLSFYLLPILTGSIGNPYERTGLVLAPTRRARGEFYRLGLFIAEHKMVRELDGPPNGIGYGDYETCQDQNKYTIKLV